MRHPTIAGLLAVTICQLAACAFITVNVYFPEQEVKKAYKTMDERYLRQDGTAAPATPPVAGDAPGEPPPPPAKENR